MGLSPEDCATLESAKKLAQKRKLDPSKITCCGCVDGTDCKYGDSQLPEDNVDIAQDIRVVTVVGQNNVDKFYKRVAVAVGQ